MNIVEKNVKDLIPYEGNPRKNEEAIESVANSIKEFGFKNPVVIDKDNVIVCGHTRVLAAKRLKMKTVPCVLADDLNEEQIKAFRLADNKTAELSTWDIPLLEIELAEINMDMEQFGFTDLDEEKPERTKKEDKLHVVTCPHCGAEIILTKNFRVKDS